LPIEDEFVIINSEDALQISEDHEPEELAEVRDEPLIEKVLEEVSKKSSPAKKQSQQSV
jgi:hypothetical protein